MIDAVTLDQAMAVPGGISGRMGPIWLQLAMSGREADAILCGGFPRRLECELELDVTSGRIQLMAFATPEAKALYQALRGVKGIGSSTALAVLDAGEPVDILRAVAGGDQRFLTRVPGLGPTRAKALSAHLRERYAHVLPQPLPVAVGEWVEARDALVAGGMEPRDAERALHDAAAAGAARAKALIDAVGSG